MLEYIVDKFMHLNMYTDIEENENENAGIKVLHQRSHVDLFVSGKKPDDLPGWRAR